ncbi:hypothetical protein [Streptomyces sp. NPDC018045]
MKEDQTTTALSSYREWLGNRRYMESAYRKYDFPVYTRKVEADGAAK